MKLFSCNGTRRTTQGAFQTIKKARSEVASGVSVRFRYYLRFYHFQ